MNTILVWLTIAFSYQPAVEMPAYGCHRWVMLQDQSIVCLATGQHAARGQYRFERTDAGLVAIVER